jgi:hypothetical protein
MKELMEMLYDWDNNRSFLLVELRRLELVDNCCKAEVVPREDAITMLFDLDLFGWEVKSYTWLYATSGRTILRIEVYRR